MTRLFIVALVCLLAGSAQAADKPLTWGLTVDDPEVLAECGSCHFAFPPVALPARSWRKIMAGLNDHFGENAALPPEKRDRIARYLTARAADTMTKGLGPYYSRDIDGLTPLRITELPVWKMSHYDGELSDDLKAEVGRWSNCQACHPGAAQGDYYGE